MTVRTGGLSERGVTHSISTGANPPGTVSPEVLRRFPRRQFYAPGNLGYLSKCVLNRRSTLRFKDCSHPESPALHSAPLPSTMSNFGDSDVPRNFGAYASWRGLAAWGRNLNRTNSTAAVVKVWHVAAGLYLCVWSALLCQSLVLSGTLH